MLLTLMVVVAVTIVLALAGYAGWLLWKLRQQRQILQRHEDEFERKKQEHEDYLIDSIQIIAQNMVADDLNLSEGSIRLKFLLDGLGLPDEERAAFNALDDLYEKVRDFDTHEARKQLSPRERNAQDLAREAHEAAHREPVLAVARTLVVYEFSGFGSSSSFSTRS